MSRRRLLPVAGCAFLVAGCGGPASALEPRGPRAAEIASLWWLMLALASIVYGVVVAILAHGLFRRRRAERPGQDPTRPATGRGERTGRLGLAYLSTTGVILPVVVVLVVMVRTVQTMGAMAEPPAPARVTVDVTGFQYWWMVRYPDQDATTANEIH